MTCVLTGRCAGDAVRARGGQRRRGVLAAEDGFGRRGLEEHEPGGDGRVLDVWKHKQPVR